MGKKRSALAVWVMAGLFSLGFSGAPAMAETVTGITAGTVDPETGAVTLKTGTFRMRTDRLRKVKSRK